MKSTIRSLIFTLCLAPVIVSCASLGPIAGIKDVTDVDWQLRTSADYERAREVLPDRLQLGHTYHIDVRYKKADSMRESVWKDLYSYEGISATVDHPLYQLDFPTLTVLPNPFLALQPNPATLTLTFPDSIGKNVAKPLVVPIPPSLPSFRGWSGQNGASGSFGTDGRDGESLDLRISRYRTDDIPSAGAEYLILAYDAISGNAWIFDPASGTIVVDASGGDGGNGGDGENRELDEDDYRDSVMGQDGGAGGRGGRGGDVVVTVDAGSDLGGLIKTNVAGGRGGKGGQGGEGEYADNPSVIGGILSIFEGITGKKGKNGTDGLAGRVSIRKGKLDRMFAGLDNPLFEPSRLRP